RKNAPSGTRIVAEIATATTVSTSVMPWIGRFEWRVISLLRREEEVVIDRRHRWEPGPGDSYPDGKERVVPAHVRVRGAAVAIEVSRESQPLGLLRRSDLVDEHGHVRLGAELRDIELLSLPGHGDVGERSRATRLAHEAELVGEEASLSSLVRRARRVEKERAEPAERYGDERERC